MKTFIFEIEILEDNWWNDKKKDFDYKKGQHILIPIKSSTLYHADIKFTNNYHGSEFPQYREICVHECDNNGFFTPKRIPKY